ncbi:thiamine-phosphate pyrophosphorylase [Caldicellulosiruptor owensensis OL]|uniref:Thiamine-phosphate synthase n=1 Tax=Caldicellulosiruptor owensensis (strain ATCC 700167 / DSM 13100 / OL) TaxID=632518 RepID=E4Q309_CALOW|nr:thiamine phosphate synthase [Caldicellulosiruptor owensensis]ADQ03845.1 thiamine-phosphate pyrophosphorylase [Caldicellulosiruptor owensensis OL]
MSLTKEEKLKLFSTYTIYGMTAEKFSKGRSNIEVVKAMLGSGIKLIQYREKYKSLKEKYKECLEIRKLTEDYGALLIVNDNADLCQIVGADGVHLGQEDLPADEVRKILGDEYIIGVTTHKKEQVLKAKEDGADYVGLGPIFASFTKDNPHPPIGLEMVKWAAENSPLPFVAIGGIKEHNLKDVLANGARCICAVTEVVGADDIQKKIKSFFEILKEFGRS